MSIGGFAIGPRRGGGVSLAPVAGVVSTGGVAVAVGVVAVGDAGVGADVGSGGLLAYFGLSSHAETATAAATVTTKEAA